jgi:hypothetical protein
MTDQNYAFRDMLGILLCADRDTLQAGQGIARSMPSRDGGHKDLGRKYVKSFEHSATTASDQNTWIRHAEPKKSALPQNSGQATDWLL